MSHQIWNGLDAGVVRYDLHYDVWRPDPYGTEVRINFHLHCYLRSSSSYFAYQIRWDALWLQGENRVSRIVKENNPSQFDFWVDSGEFSIWTDKDYIWGCHLIMKSPNNSPSGWYDTGTDINIWCPPMQTKVPAHPQTDGAIYSTNNSNGVHRGTIKDLKTSQIWFDWWGQTNGSPHENEINFYAVDCNKINDVGSASSWEGKTFPYRANTRLNMQEMFDHYGMQEGDTLYCWVNCVTFGGQWLGRQYLGAITVMRGKLMYKDNAGNWHQCYRLREKDNNGAVKNCSTLKVKDNNGTIKNIDLFL